MRAGTEVATTPAPADPSPGLAKALALVKEARGPVTRMVAVAEATERDLAAAARAVASEAGARLADLERQMRVPADRAEVALWLVGLARLVRKPPADLKGEVGSLAVELAAEFPLACLTPESRRRIAEQCRFWPPYGQLAACLRPELDALRAQAAALGAVVRASRAPEPAPADKAAGAPPKPKERAVIARTLSGLAGELRAASRPVERADRERAPAPPRPDALPTLTPAQQLARDREAARTPVLGEADQARRALAQMRLARWEALASVSRAVSAGAVRQE